MASAQRIARVAVVVTLAAGVGAVLAGPASADPPGLVHAGSSSATTNLPKSWTTTCPRGTVVTGGGGYLIAPAAPHIGKLALDQLEPLDDGSGFTASMKEVFPDGANWTLGVDAQCMPEPPGYDVIAQPGVVNTATVHAICPGSKTLIGMGGRINAGQGAIVLDRVVPSADMKTVSVRGTPVPGAIPPSNWSVTAFAVCAFVAGVHRVSFSNPASSASTASANWTCPAGEGLYSVGAEISPGSGEVFLRLLRAIDVHKYSIGADEDGAYAPNWSATLWGICGP